jgi:hypothetical protein
MGRDGWTRKYLYRSGLGGAQPQQFLIWEVPPSGSYEVPMGPPLPSPQAASQLPLMMESRMDLTKMAMPKMGIARPLPLKTAPRPLMGNTRMGQAFPIGGGSLPVGQPNYVPPPAQQKLIAPPAAPEPACPVGPIQMPDGRMLNPDDTITLNDLCAMIPSIAKALAGVPAKGGNRLGPVPVAGQAQNGMQSITAPNAFGQPGAGPGGGPAGGGGMGFGFGGGGGGAPGAQGPVGQAGVAGAQGATGIGSTFDFVSKDDGDFTAGPGDFIPVPGTLLAFSVPQDGNVMFQVQATLGCGQSQNGALGLRIDGTDYPITKRLLQTFAVGVAEFYEPSTYIFPKELLAGAHTVEVLLRGLEAGSECSASGLGLSQTVSASPEAPLILICQHSVAGSPAPGAAVLQVSGVRKTDGDFLSTTLDVVPGTAFAFTVSRAAMVQFNVNAILESAAGSTFPDVQVGIRLDGVTDYILGDMREQQGAGGDRIFRATMSPTIPISLVPGSHTVEMIYSGGSGAPMTLLANTDRAASIAVLHP